MSTKDRTYYRTKEFIQLQNKWYKKLTKEGFVDLEWLDKKSGLGHSSPFLTGSSSNFKSLQLSTYSETLEYYNAAQAFTYHYKFPSALHRFTWTEHAAGTSYRQIIKKIKSRAFKHKPSIFWISTHVNKMRQEMFKWYAKQDSPEETWQTFLESNEPVYT